MSRKLPGLYLVLLLTGCIETEHALVPAKEAIPEPRLEGVWKGDDAVYSLQRLGQDPASYRLVQIKGQATTVLSEGPLLFRLGRRYFLIPKQEEMFWPMRVSFAGDELRVRALNDRWLEDYLTKHREALKHDRKSRSDRFGTWSALVLQAPTKDLQKFFEEHMDELFSSPVARFTRVGKPALPLLAKEGLASPKQRTFDYWDEVRYQLASVPLWRGASRANGLENCNILARVLKEIPTDLIAREAADAGREQTLLFSALAAYLREGKGPADVVSQMVDLLKAPRKPLPRGQASLEPIRRQAQKAAELAKQARERLGKRYEEEFPPWRWRVSEVPSS
jgi:hypothetical protein